MQPTRKHQRIETDSLVYATMESPIGILGVAATDKGVCNIRTAQKSESQFLRYLEDVYTARPMHDPKRLKPVIDELKAYFKGELTEFDCELDLTCGTPFQQTVWKRLLTIPFGETRSYGWLAEKLKNPNASRAVGNANGKNPVPVIIPCHRVIHADGGLGGYTGGLHIKEFLLDLETHAHAPV
ncbi:methylated-DNA--[protein]-cysteine S-methyltransferase [Nitrospina gracilis]|uniref:methylated-DNA--[protein]-cysteine S-methyltransferase n=1 Tax=Nitrospina gracilis TaxID=35801 RepID=UPI001F2A10D9|nr:methylated-DNA--[protein]-cysteine S-methyltransferase [Nitrospina gracilis]MCF8720531.1 methylated-DNA-[protein]-cysteine S-methyltransferase [Nitrospina gracilis Nb-211]